MLANLNPPTALQLQAVHSLPDVGQPLSCEADPLHYSPANFACTLRTLSSMD